MIYNEFQYGTLAERFNSQSFTQKLLTIKSNSNIFTLETNGYMYYLRLENDAMLLELDSLFEFPTTLEYEHLKAIFSLIDINVKPLP